MPFPLTHHIHGPASSPVHQNTLIKGIHISNRQNKISLYADDVLLFLQDPQESFTEDTQLIQT